MEARLGRKPILDDVAGRVEFVMAEAPLRWGIGPPQMMRAQLDRITSLATLPNVGIGVIPQAAEVAAWHIHGFAILDDSAVGNAIVRVETLTTGLSITDPDAVQRYRQAFASLREAAIFGDQTQGFLRGLLEELG